MRAIPGPALCLLVALAAGCGGDDDVDIVGDSPEEAAEEIVGATCDWQADCGIWSIECELDEDGTILGCTATHIEVDRDECVAEDIEDVREDLECAMPTDDEAEQINACINDLLARDCVSEEEVEAYVEAIERGEDPDEPGEVPASCDGFQEIFAGCDDGGA